MKCGGTARIVQVYISDIIPCFVMDTFYMTFDKKGNYWEFGPLLEFSKEERHLINGTKRYLKKLGLTYLSKKNASRRFEELRSDCVEKNASLFSVLFSDTDDYQNEIKRFNDKRLIDPTGKKISWTEYYNRNHKLKRREEYRYFPSKNVECIVTDSDGKIIEVKVWRDIGRETHHEFVLDIVKEIRDKKSGKRKADV